MALVELIEHLVAALRGHSSLRSFIRNEINNIFDDKEDRAYHLPSPYPARNGLRGLRGARSSVDRAIEVEGEVGYGRIGDGAFRESGAGRADLKRRIEEAPMLADSV